jgi:hypothetical protein
MIDGVPDGDPSSLDVHSQDYRRMVRLCGLACDTVGRPVRSMIEVDEVEGEWDEVSLEAVQYFRCDRTS